MIKVNRLNREIQYALLFWSMLSVLLLYSVTIQKNRNVIFKGSTQTSIGLKRSITISPIYRKISSSEFTHDIGTTLKPTIDGGIINTLDEVTIVQPETNDALPRQNLAVSKKSIGVKPDRSFKDDWATSQRVKTLLHQAASENKLHLVLQKIDKLDMPGTVAVVPMIESNYQTRAISVKGAAGPWQLMDSVAHDYGLQKRDKFDLSLSTNAALNLLQNLHAKFNNWELTYAAYNAGSQRVSDALQKNPKATTLEELDLPQETKSFVNRIRGVSALLMQVAHQNDK